ncbi:MAG TPA: PAS domain S-box protein [Pyrinomonadaceae bacterium]|nr:PAS domain S-box protein [Pyrinomonadaceae bacterium]
MADIKRSPLLRYGIAILLVALATVITWFLQAEHTRTPFAFYFIAVVAATIYAGRGPGLVAVALSAIVSSYFILPPRFSFLIGSEGLIQLGVFLFVALVISSLMERARGAERKTRLGEASLRTTLQSIGDAVISTDAEGRVIFMNPVAQALTGWPLDEAVGRRLPEVFHIVNEHSRQPVESPTEKVLRDGMVVGLANHTLLLARDGREIPIDDSGAPIRDEEGRITGVVLVFHDITERRRGEEAALKLAAIVESAEDAIFGKTLEGVINSWNKGAQRLYGYTAEEAIGRNVSMLVPEERMDELASIMERLRGGESIEHFETIRRTKEGQLVHVALTISVIKNVAGGIIGASTIARNITERRQAEEALRESEERFAKAFASSPLALTITSLKTGRLMEVNETFTQLSGYARDEAVGRSTVELGLWARPSDREAELGLIAETGKVHNTEYRFLMRDGRKLVGMLSAERIVIGGEPCALTVIQDITEQKRAEEERERLFHLERQARREAEEANRLKDEFLATLSHELRTPLTAMLGWTRMLRTRMLDEKTSRHALATIERNVRSQTQLIEDLLDVSRIITGKLRLDTRPVELASVIEAAIDSIQPAAEAKEILLERAIDPTAGPVLGDPARMQQVVWNLLSNAVKFTPKGGRVQVALERSDSYAAISVTDTGAGISHDFLPYVFDRFRQADSSSTRSHGGLGLGLAIVRHLVELHGGAVEAASQGAQRGACFTVKLPLMAVNIRRDGAGEGKGDGIATGEGAVLDCPPLLKGLRILVVDDEEDAQQLLATILRQCEAVVETASSAQQAIEAARASHPDLLISDIGMPDEDGYDLLERVRKDPDPEVKEVPAVALTGYASEEDRARSFAAGFQIHLTKPIDPQALIAAISQLVKKDSPQRAAEKFLS